jgi:hypothetical protein
VEDQVEVPLPDNWAELDIVRANAGLLEQFSCRSVEKRFIGLYLASDQGPEVTAV